MLLLVVSLYTLYYLIRILTPLTRGVTPLVPKVVEEHAETVNRAPYSGRVDDILRLIGEVGKGLHYKGDLATLPRRHPGIVIF